MTELMKRKSSKWGALSSQVGVQDCLFLSLVVLLSVILYVWNLGFYSDDWHFLGNWFLSDDQSLVGLIRAFHEPNVAMRPVQTIYLSVLYWLFGLDPLGYHLVNAAVLMSGIVLFYVVLRELNQNHLLALVVPLVYGLLPHYSTNRFWFAAFQINLSMALYFLSLYCDLRMLKARPRYLWGWKFLSIASIVTSGLAYEVFLPLFLFNPLLVLYHRRQLERSTSGTQLSWGKLAVLLGSNILALMLVVVFKKLVTIRLGGYPSFINQIKFLIKGSITVNYDDYGFRLPRVIWRIIWDYPNPAIFILAGVLGLIVFGYLDQVASQSKVELPSLSSMLKLIGLGTVIYGLGYAIFLTNSNVGFTSTGIHNRTAMAAAVGLALSLVGVLGWVSQFLNSSYARKRFFCLLIALLCTSGFLINNTIASFWIAAYHQQQEIMANIRSSGPTLPAASTVLLDGFCPYIGPAIVFETNWDVLGALKTIYRDQTLQADVVRPNLKVKEDGIYTFIYDQEAHYPYKQLFVYNIGRKITYQLTDADAARRYFAEFNPNYSNGCPKGSEGKGVRIF